HAEWVVRFGEVAHIHLQIRLRQICVAPAKYSCELKQIGSLRLRFGGILAQAPCWRASSLGALERKNPKDAVQDAPVVDTRTPRGLFGWQPMPPTDKTGTGISEITP